MELREVAFESLPGWSDGDLTNVWPTFLSSCRAVVDGLKALRPGKPPEPRLVEACRIALGMDADPGRIHSFFKTEFRAFEVILPDGSNPGFVTGYYEPELDGSVSASPGFPTPALCRPSDLIDMRGVQAEGWDPHFEGARRTTDGRLEPYPDRAAIEGGAIAETAKPIVWLRDHVELFFAQVQGSARIALDDGRHMRLVYAGRNGHPYRSIGRELIEAGEIRRDEMSLARCKEWLRAHGLRPGDAGRALMQRNRSYVFFRLMEDCDPDKGPIGAQGVPLTPMRSIAVDRNIWSYGVPFWIAADLSNVGIGDGPTGRLMVAQDTGSAIIGPARGDLYIGSGDGAGRIAGNIRHPARFFAFLPAGS